MGKCVRYRFVNITLRRLVAAFGKYSAHELGEKKKTKKSVTV